jgi:NAD+ kinase
VKTAVLVTPTHPNEATEGVAEAARFAREASVELVISPEEHEKHGKAVTELEPAEKMPERPDVCLVLGGDGSILYALRRYAGTGVPVFGINYGTVGFLAAVEREELGEGLRRAFTGDFEVMDMPGLEAEVGNGPPVALNDISFLRRPEGRVAQLSYRVGDEEVGKVRCDGLVAATPAGSTGYNLANGGPILAWGVKGFVVSFIAPHTLTTRALVVAPMDALHVGNAAGREPVEVSLDGEASGVLEPGDEIEIRFSEGVASLAQLPGANFYHRIREKFGRLAQ